jgi:hypothetical protein
MSKNPSIEEPSSNGSATAATNGRDNKGRFTRGNKGGPGNPFAAIVAKLRKAALAVVTPEELQAVFRVLLLRAQSGHLPSMKLLFLYTLGKPAAAVDPDDIDEEDEEPAPPPVSPAGEEQLEEDPEEIEDEAFEEPSPPQDDPVAARDQLFLESLTDTISEIPVEVREELARRFRTAPVPQPAPEQSRKTASARPQPSPPAVVPRKSDRENPKTPPGSPGRGEPPRPGNRADDRTAEPGGKGGP